jgi:acetyl esterase/lipase
MKTVFADKAYFYCSLAAVLAAFFVYQPLPEGMGETSKVYAVETILRLVYFYPAQLLGRLFGTKWQLAWTRATLHTLIGVTNPVFKTDPDMGIEDTEFNGVPVRVYTPHHLKSDGAVIFIHGGGFVLLSVDAYDGVTREIARKTGMVTISIEYRLAPEHRFPAAIEDVEAATVHFLTSAHRNYSVDPMKVAVVGDSAGGNLATVVAQRLRNHPLRPYGLPALRAQALIYPVLQFSDFQLPSYQFYKSYDRTAFMDPSSIAKYLSAYLGVDIDRPEHVNQVLTSGHSAGHLHQDWDLREELSHENLPLAYRNTSTYQGPSANPSNPSSANPSNGLAGFPSIDWALRAAFAPFLNNPDFAPLMQKDLRDMPATFISTCQFDVLRDEGYLYASRLVKQGIPVTYRHYEDAFHTILNFHSDLAAGQKAMGDVVRFLREELI